MRILAVDDDEIILEILKAALLTSGHSEIDTATSAPEAMAMIDASPEPYDCFMLDIIMPEIDGIELCKWIKRQRAYSAKPVIMVTAMSERSYIQRAFAAGATDYVTKPFDPLELGTRVSMAHRLVLEGARVREKAMEVRLLRDQLEEKIRAPFDEPVTILGVAGVIGMVNMENFLLQMSRAGLFGASALAIKVAGLDACHRAMSPSDFYFLLEDAAEALTSALRGKEYFVSYAGNGTFVAIIHGPARTTTDDLEAIATGALQSMDATEGYAGLPELTFVFGQSIGFGVMGSGISAVQTLYSAIARLDQDVAQSKKYSQIPERHRPHKLADLLHKALG